MTEKKRHHYIPRFYLNGFIDPRNRPYIWVYEKGKSTIRKSKSDKIAAEKYYYSFSLAEGERDSETLENFLAEIESSVVPIFQKINERESLSDKERNNFSFFLAFTMTRVPAYRDNVKDVTEKLIKRMTVNLASNPKAFESMMKEYQKETGDKVDIPIEQLREFAVHKDKYSVEVDPQFSLGIMMIAKDLWPIFYKMNWAFLEATDDFKFVTSDNPLFYDDPTHDPNSPYGLGLVNRNIEVTFPISKELMFLGTWKDYTGFKKTSNKIVKNLNRRTVVSASRFVFASQKSDTLNRFVQKYIDTGARLQLG